MGTYRITAGSQEQFMDIQQEVDKMPLPILLLVESAEKSLAGIIVTLRRNGNAKIDLPKGITAIETYDDYVMVFHPLYLIKIPLSEHLKYPNFIT